MSIDRLKMIKDGSSLQVSSNTGISIKDKR